MLVLTSFHVSKADPVIVTAKLNQATVYFKGAELNHSVNATLNRGENEVLIKGLSPNVDKNSIRISTTNGVLVNSFEFSADYLNVATVTPQVKVLQDSLKLCQEKIKDLDDQIVTINDGLDLLNKNKTITSQEKGVSITNLVQVVDYFQTKTASLLKDRRLVTNQKEVLAKTVSRLEWQINQEAGKNNKSAGLLKLQLMAPASTPTKIEVVYYTQQAKWNPTYDINVTNISKPVSFITKAQISQTTGLDWDKVKLTLSTATPAYGAVAPTLNTWFLYPEEVSYPAIAEDNIELNEVVAIKEMRSAKRDVAASVSSVGMVVSKPVPQPIYVVNGSIVDANYAKSLDPKMIKSSMMLDEGQAVAMYGSKAAAGAFVITLKDTMDDFITQTDGELDRLFEIDLLYSVPGNGKSQSIVIQSQEVKGTFKYYIVPKMSLDAYLMVEIADWSKLNLMPGVANITFDGTYIGKTNLNTQSTDQVLALTLGVDKRITVKRDKFQDFSSRKLLGNDIRQQFVYQISVKNGRNQPVDITVKEQLPVSTTKDISVELTKETMSPPTRYNTDTGMIEWDFTLKPSESKVLKNAYSVKYPKDMNLNL